MLTLKNLESAYRIELVSATGTPNYVKDIGYVSLIGRVYCNDPNITNPKFELAWQRFDKNDNYLDNNFFIKVRDNEEKEMINKQGQVIKYYETEIKYPCNMVDQFNTITCTFYLLNIEERTIIIGNDEIADAVITKSNLGTATLLINTTDVFNYKISILNGDVLYKYDSDGDSPMVAEYDGPVSSKVKEIQPINFRIFKNDGTELNSTEYLYCSTTWAFPKNSMLKLDRNETPTDEDDNYYYISGQGQLPINYSIINSYNVKKNDNTILLTVQLQNDILTEAVTIKFLKDGESGTNGSKYAGLITYNGKGYAEPDSNNKPVKLHCVYCKGLGWGYLNNNIFTDWEDRPFDVKVYCDGDLITDGYNVSWELFDESQTNSYFRISRGILAIKNIDVLPAPDDNSVTIVQAKISITDNSITNSGESIYVYYPVEVTYLESSNLAIVNGLIPNIEDGYSQVLYAADGTNPKYDNSNPFVYSNNLQDINSDIYCEYKWTCSDNLTIKRNEDTGTTCTCKPGTKFDNGDTLNYIRVSTKLKSDAQIVLDQELSEKQAEWNYLKALDRYYYQVATKIKNEFTDEDTKIFDYTTYINSLNNNKEIIDWRNELILYVKQLQSALVDINNYIASREIDTESIELSDIDDLNTLLNNLYYFGSIELITYDDIISLKLITFNEDIFKEKYGIAIYGTFKSLIDIYNNIISKYNNSRTGIIDKEDKDILFNNLSIFFGDILNIRNKEEIATFVNEDYNIGPEQKFVDVKNEIISITNRLFKIDDDCSSYDNINSQIFIPLQGIIDEYSNDFYYTEYRNLSDLTKYQAEEVQVEINDYNTLLQSTDEDAIIIHTKPIVMILNRYEMSNLNGWDGSKLYIDENNNEYILAPQVGAGLKDAEGGNTFTGFVMGIKQFNQKTGTKQKIGLFGYNQGIQTYFLNAENGSAIMGKSGKGQITIDPLEDRALIYSGNFFNDVDEDGKPRSYAKSNWNKEGMLIDLTTPQIVFGSGSFEVNSEGHLTAKGGGSIGGWEIGDTTLYSNVSKPNGRITLDSGVEIDEETGETIYTKGKIYSGMHEKINSTSNGFYLSDEGLSIGSKVYIGKDGIMKLGNGAVASVPDPVPTRGLRAGDTNYWTVNGDSTGSYISYGTESFKGGSQAVYLGTQGISAGGSQFWVNQLGEMHSQSGDIAGWDIDDSTLSAGGTILNKNGTITCSNLIAQSNGYIGNWSIGSEGLTNGDLKITDGIYGPNFDLTSAGLSLTGGSIKIGGFNLSADNLSAAFAKYADLTIGGISFDLQCKKLTAEVVTADYINNKIADIGTLTAQSIHASHNITADQTLKGSAVFAGNTNLGTAIENRALKGHYSVKGTINGPTGGNLRYDLYIDL